MTTICYTHDESGHAFASGPYGALLVLHDPARYNPNAWISRW